MNKKTSQRTGVRSNKQISRKEKLVRQTPADWLSVLSSDVGDGCHKRIVTHYLIVSML